MQTVTEVIRSSNPNLILTADLELGNLTETELVAAREAKKLVQSTFTAEYARRMNLPQFPRFDSSAHYLSWVINRGTALMQLEEERAFVLDQENLFQFQQLSAYFMGDERYWPSKLDPKKGLLLCGGYGSGKTFGMRLFASNPRQSFRIISARSITEEYRTNGDLCTYKVPFLAGCSARHFGHRELGICIDDMGAETTASNFGNNRNVIGELLLDRYEIPALRGCMTHAITNATAIELRDTYGPRVYDRLRQLFNILEFSQESRRQ